MLFALYTLIIRREPCCHVVSVLLGPDRNLAAISLPVLWSHVSHMSVDSFFLLVVVSVLIDIYVNVKIDIRCCFTAK